MAFTFKSMRVIIKSLNKITLNRYVYSNKMPSGKSSYYKV